MSLLAPKLFAARAVASVSRRTGRGGTSLPGKVLMKLEPSAMAQLASRLDRGSAVISATNGKTTTAAMAAAILDQGGSRLVHNRAGANMSGGIATTLLQAADGQGIDGDTGLFEVDEFWLADVVAQVHPKTLLLANLFRDQLDRYGELETIAGRWAELVSGLRTTRVILNADDPLVAGLSDRNVIHFGVEDTSVALEGMQHASDSKHCRVCGAPYVYDAVFLGHLGHYHCENCGATRPAPQFAADDVVLDGVRGARFTLKTPDGSAEIALPLPGLYNVYNALAAATLAQTMGASLAEVVAGLHAVAPAFGRAETVKIGGRDVLVLLIKNPAGANEVLRTLLLEDGQHDLLCVLNDRIADGRDVSWIWDADFEVLAPRVRRAVCSGTRAAEMALRLKYAGVPEESLIVVEKVENALDEAVDGADARVMALPTYTAMLELRELLADRGLVKGPIHMTDPAIWHDIENGPYREDLALWHTLAMRYGQPVLDIGCGTGRVALDLARGGFDVIAFDNDEVLVEALMERTGDLSVQAFAADARDFTLDRQVPLAIVPMQTVQLLDGVEGRARMLQCVRAVLAPGGALAFAIADARTATTSPDDLLPAPDMKEIDGVVYASRPVAVVDEGDAVSIHRAREIVDVDGSYSESSDRIALDVLSPEELEAEGEAAGFTVLPREAVAETGEYISSTVVMLGG